VTAVKRCLAVLLVVAVALTVLEVGADASARRRRRRRAHQQEKRTRVEDRQVSNLGVTIAYHDSEATVPLGGGTLFEDPPDYFDGSISGFKASCQGRIVVEIFMSSGASIGSVEASDDGTWSFTREDPNNGDGDFSAFARATRYGTGKGARFACGKGISDTEGFTDNSSSLV